MQMSCKLQEPSLVSHFSTLKNLYNYSFLYICYFLILLYFFIFLRTNLIVSYIANGWIPEVQNIVAVILSSYEIL